MILELGPGADILRAIGVAYWLLAAGAIILVWWLGKRWWIKVPLTIAILALSIHPVYKQDQKNQETTAASNARYETAKKMFEERCKSAGEKIYRTVENVDGIFLMKVRPDKVNFSDQFALDDPYGSDLGGDAYIRSFLRGFFEANFRRPDIPKSDAPPHKGYQYVEAVDPQDGKRYRYTGSMKATRRKDSSAPNVQIELKRDPNYDLNVYDFVLDRVAAFTPSPRYGVTYDDISTTRDLEYWIAGSSLKVIDLQTKEVIAERIGYMFDPGQGNTSAGRSPWLLAADHACPSFGSRHGSRSQLLQSEIFVERILKPGLEK